MVKIGVAGAGRIGQRHAENLHTRIPNAQLVAVSDVDKVRAQKLAKKLGNIGWYDDYERMLEEEDMEALLISASTDVHKEMITSAAKRGKHIFCEKPVTITLKETNEALATVEKAQVLMQVGFVRRFDPALASAKEKIEEGSIGKPLLFKAVSRDPEGPSLEYVRVSGGLLVDSSIHDIDLARWFMDSEVDKVYTEGRVLIYPEFKEAGDIDTALTTLAFRNGGLGNIENSRKSGYGYDNRIEIIGSEGTLQIGYLRNQQYSLLNRRGVTHDVVPSWKDRFSEAFVRELEHFVDCVINNRIPLVTGIDGKRALEIALAATKSWQKGSPIRLESH